MSVPYIQGLSGVDAYTMDAQKKYLKYKIKYLELKNLLGGDGEWYQWGKKNNNFTSYKNYDFSHRPPNQEPNIHCTKFKSGDKHCKRDSGTPKHKCGFFGGKYQCDEGTITANAYNDFISDNGPDDAKKKYLKYKMKYLELKKILKLN